MPFVTPPLSQWPLRLAVGLVDVHPQELVQMAQFSFSRQREQVVVDDDLQVEYAYF